MTPARVILHLPERYLDSFRITPHLALYGRIEAEILARGGRIELQGRPATLFTGGTVAGDGDLHIVENGRIRGEGYLNATLAYFESWWHLDPAGVLADSSIADRQYDPDLIPRAPADRFFADLHARFAAPRKSRYGQAHRVQNLPEGAIAVFLQGPLPQKSQQAHCSYLTMLRAVAQGAGGRPVLVKPHPLKREMGQAQIAQVKSEGYDIIETNANLHDILAKAAVSVSINSAAALEGFLHATPAILFGRSDFHHFVETVEYPAHFAQALQVALGERHDYAKALYWYFRQNCLCLDAPEFGADLLAILAASGFDAARLGLRP